MIFVANNCQQSLLSDLHFIRPWQMLMKCFEVTLSLMLDFKTFVSWMYLSDVT